MSVENLEPETLIVSFQSPPGIQSEKAAMQGLKQQVKTMGLDIDWQKPEVEKSAHGETKTFWDQDSGHNGRAFLEYTNKKLTGIGYGMAL